MSGEPSFFGKVVGTKWPEIGVRQSDRLEMSCLLGTSVAECTVLEAGDMRQALCAEFSLPPEPQTLRL